MELGSNRNNRRAVNNRNPQQRNRTTNRGTTTSPTARWCSACAAAAGRRYGQRRRWHQNPRTQISITITYYQWNKYNSPFSDATEEGHCRIILIIVSFRFASSSAREEGSYTAFTPSAGRSRSMVGYHTPRSRLQRHRLHCVARHHWDGLATEVSHYSRISPTPPNTYQRLPSFTPSGLTNNEHARLSVNYATAVRSPSTHHPPAQLKSSEP
jgi:hypothetical protein